MSLKYLPKNTISLSEISKDKKSEYIKMLIKTGQPMMLKYIDKNNVIFSIDMPIYSLKQLRFTAVIPWDNRELFISDSRCEITFVYPSKLNENYISVKYR